MSTGAVNPGARKPVVSVNSLIGNVGVSYKDLMANVKSTGYNMGEIVFKQGKWKGSFSRVNNHVGYLARFNNVVTTAEQNRATNAAVFKALLQKYGGANGAGNERILSQLDLDVEFADLSLVAGLNELARKRKKRIFVTTTFPFRTAKGSLTLPAVEVAAQTACGMSLGELAEAVVCVQSRKPNGVNMDAVVEVLKGQFFAARSKVEQESGLKPGFVAMARSLLNSLA